MIPLFEQEEKGSSQTTVSMKEWRFPVLPPQEPLTAGVDIRLELPAEMGVMPPERQEAYYPYEEPPEIILSDPEENIQATLQVLDLALKPEETYPAAARICDEMRRDHPGNRLSTVFLEDKAAVPAGWFVMEMPERGWEHMKAIFSIHNRAVLLTFTWHEDARARWYPVLAHVLRSIREVKKVTVN